MSSWRDRPDPPSYKVDHRLIYHPEFDDVLVIRYLPYGDDEDIADRMRRTTISHSAKAYPRQPPAVQKRNVKAILKDPHPAFQVENILVALLLRLWLWWWLCWLWLWLRLWLWL